MTLDDLERRIQRLPKVFKYPLLSQERVKLRSSNFTAHSQDRSEQKAIKNSGNSCHGRSQELPKIFRAPIYRAHRAVLLAIAWYLVNTQLGSRTHSAFLVEAA